jgi:CRP-like cAMP-binding protein
LPLLADGQDPDGLAARVAFHLHRLGITTAHLTQAEMYREIARQLRRGSVMLSTKDVAELATALQLDVHDLSRPLTDDEKAEWRFYRTSARQVTEVWRRVAEASTAHNFTQQQISELLEISKSAVSRAIRGERKTPVLNWHDAAKIADALQLPDGADAFISGLFPQENVRERSG